MAACELSICTRPLTFFKPTPSATGLVAGLGQDRRAADHGRRLPRRCGNELGAIQAGKQRRANITTTARLVRVRQLGRQQRSRYFREGNSNGKAKAGLAIKLTFFDECSAIASKRWLIKGVAAIGETSSWIAPPGRGKSALQTDLSVNIAAGMDWRGYRSKGPHGVVYFAFERGDLVKRRLTAYARRHNLKALPIAVASQIIDLMHPGCVDVILATIRAAEKRFGIRVGYIVIDTFAKGIAAGGGDEDKARDQNKCLDQPAPAA